MSYKNLVKIVFLLILFVAMPLIKPHVMTAQSSDGAVVHAILFYSDTCYHCHQVITNILTPMQEEYGDELQILGLETTPPGIGQLFQSAIDYYKISPERRGVPFLIVGDIVLVGSGEIPNQFPKIVEDALEADGIAWPDFPGIEEILATIEEPTPTLHATDDTPIPTPSSTTESTTVVAIEEDTSAPNQDAEPVYLAYFFDPTCLECVRVSAELEDIQATYPNLVVRKLNVQDEAALNEAMSEKYNVPEKYRMASPMVFIGQEYLAPDEITVERLVTLIEDPETAKSDAPWESLETDESTATDSIVERFKRFGILAIIGAGLLDGINPCAFTTIIFFVSYLALVGRQGKEILIVGTAFTVAVFLTYLAMGLGLAEFVRQIKSFALIGQIIYGITALICLALAALSFSDYLKIRRGELSDISLQLPKFLKKRIHKTIRTHSRMNGYIWAAFVAGVLVSVFELACTGQVYLPTIIFVIGIADMRLTAFAYLVLYNLMFVTPLIIVFGVTYLGTSSKQLTTVFQQHAGAVKILTTVLFGVLGIWLGYMVLTI